jgi:hypothetical protein
MPSNVFFVSLDMLSNTGNLMHWAECWMQQHYLIIYAWRADYFTNIHFYSKNQPHRPVCEASNGPLEKGIEQCGN